MYSPKQPLGTDKVKDVSDWAYDEFKEVEKGFQDLDRIRLATSFVEPAKKRDGDIAFADGTEWDPGNGEGLYIYHSGTWNALFNTASGTITGNVGATDNRLVRSSGASGTVLDSTGITADDSNNLTGVGTLDIGNADTTLSRFGAGDVQVESKRIFRVDGTDVPVADGGTGASDATTARTNLEVGFALLTSGTMSNQATLDIPLTSYTAYRGIIIKLVALPATDAVELYCRFSTDGGSTYIATGYNYSAIYVNEAIAANGTGNGSANQIQLSINAANTHIGNAATEGWMGSIEMLSQTSAGFWSRVNFQGYYITDAATPTGVAFIGGGAQETAQDTDAIRFLFSAGNIASGSYTVYGMH